MRISFGLSDEYIEDVYEQFFFLKYSGGWSFSEAYNLPVGLRKWFVERLLRQLEVKKKAMEKRSKIVNCPQTLTPQNPPPPPKNLF